MSDELNLAKETFLLVAGGAIGFVSSLATAMVVWHVQSRKSKRARPPQSELGAGGIEKDLTSDPAHEPADDGDLTPSESAEAADQEPPKRFSEIIVVGGTRITLSDKSQKAVEELEAGMELLSYDNRMFTNTAAKITGISTDDTNRHIVVNDDIKLTEANRVETDKGIQNAFAVSVGNAILRQDNLYKEVKSIQLIYGKTITYAVKMDTRCGIFAENYCVVDL